MPILLNTILTSVGVSLSEVRLLRHQDKRSAPGRSPYALWCYDRQQFELYQATQSFANRAKLNARYWAVFIANLTGKTMFVGLYQVNGCKPLGHDVPSPHIEGETERANTCDFYDIDLQDVMKDLIGRLFIDWGSGMRSWIQHAARQDKCVEELRPAFQEETFPGFLNFIEPLSKIAKLPSSWGEALRSARGVYLLTCPMTKQQYVGSAGGEAGFLGRWHDYLENGHGGNVALGARSLVDYQVSILEVAGSSASSADIAAMEGRWQLKLQSCEMGLNRNLARRLQAAGP